MLVENDLLLCECQAQAMMLFSSGAIMLICITWSNRFHIGNAQSLGKSTSQAIGSN